jgi:hypothetical protein
MTRCRTRPSRFAAAATAQCWSPSARSASVNCRMYVRLGVATVTAAGEAVDVCQKLPNSCGVALPRASAAQHCCANVLRTADLTRAGPAKKQPVRVYRVILIFIRCQCETSPLETGAERIRDHPLNSSGRRSNAREDWSFVRRCTLRLRDRSPETATAVAAGTDFPFLTDFPNGDYGEPFSGHRRRRV